MTFARIPKRVIRRCLAPFALRHQSRRIVIFHLGRSGSTVLSRMIESGGTVSDGEILEPYLINQLGWPWQDFDRSGEAKPSSKIDVERFLLKRLRMSFARNYSCEFKPFQLRLSGSSIREAVEACSKLGFTGFVALRRRNALRIIVSALRASEQDLWHTKENVETKQSHVPIERLPLDRERAGLIACLERLESDWQEIESNLPPDSLHLTYEDDIEHNPATGAAKLAALLHQPKIGVPKLRRTGAAPLSHLVENWDEVCHELANTRFAWMTKVDV